MVGRRRNGADLRRILTLGDTVPRSVGGILVAMLVSTIAAMVSRGLWGLASLDGPADPDAEAAWDVEIERRVAAIEAGTIRLEPWADVKRRIEKKILGR